MTTKTPITTADLAHFTGTEGYHVATLMGRRFLLTDGALFVAQNAGNGAFWLFEIVASVLMTDGKGYDAKAGGFAVWRVQKVTDVEGVMARVDAWTDIPGESHCLYTQDIGYSDFPFDSLGDTFEFWVEGTGDDAWVALLKSEH